MPYFHLLFFHPYVRLPQPGVCLFVCLFAPLPGHELLGALYYTSWDGGGGSGEGDAVVANLVELSETGYLGNTGNKKTSTLL